MSFASTGSTAPTISSPLLAWPRKPSQRLSPSLASPAPLRRPSSSTSVTLTEDTIMSASSSSVTIADGPQYGRETTRKYKPPKRPLDPQKLGRIAQSFGVIVPSLPDFALASHHTLGGGPAPKSAPVHSAVPLVRSTTPTPVHASPHLLTVLPPAFLLPPTVSDDEAVLKRWRRGKLLPLQPTLSMMAVAIAREWGLPSIRGLELYITSDTKGKGREIDGPQITAQTWSTLFQPFIRSSAAMDRAGSSAHLDRLRTESLESVQSAPSFKLNADVVYPPSPISLDGQAQVSTEGAKTPAPSVTNMTASVVATIEFDIDAEKAESWLEAWHQKGGSRRGAAPMSGRKGLTLLNKTEQASQPRFLTELESSSSDSPSPSLDGEGYAALSDVDGDSSDENAFQHEDPVFGSDLADLRDLRQTPTEGAQRALDITDIGSDAVLAPDARFDTELDDAREDDVDDVLKMLEESDGLPPMRPFVDEERLLASPIALGMLGTSEADKRASGVVMSEKLDDLEKALRSLSPRDLRLTSPRVLPTGGERFSPLSASSLPSRTVSRPARSPLIPQAESPSFEYEQSVSTPVWPAVPFTSDSSPVHTPRTVGEEGKPTTLSPETMQRMEYEPLRMKQSPAGWKPQRPARPPSPDLSIIAAREHPLSPEIVQALERHTAESPISSESPVMGESPVAAEPGAPRRERSNSIRLRGLRSQMSIPKMNKLWHRRDDRVPDMPTSETAVGLFAFANDDAGRTEDESHSQGDDVTAVRGVPDEFGAVAQPTKAAASSLPSKPSSGFGRRILNGFASRRREPNSPDASASRTHRIISSPIIVQKGSGLDPPIAVPSTPPPITESLSAHSLHSPTSPHSVRRKPVPELENDEAESATIPNSMSLASSMASFVLEDPPKRKVRAI